MTSVRLAAYLTLERAMLELDSAGDAVADRLRDAMDPLWYGLTDTEHAWLDSRALGEPAESGASPRPPRADQRALNFLRARKARHLTLARQELDMVALEPKGPAAVEDLLRHVPPMPAGMAGEDRWAPR